MSFRFSIKAPILIGVVVQLHKSDPDMTSCILILSPFVWHEGGAPELTTYTTHAH